MENMLDDGMRFQELHNIGETLKPKILIHIKWIIQNFNYECVPTKVLIVEGMRDYLS